MNIARIFRPDHEKYEGVRPFQIYGLRTFYFLMAAFVGTDAWMRLITFTGEWDHVRAVAWCVWAAYPTMGVLGLFKPLKLLPIMIFMVFYKSLWLVFIAYPLWSNGTLIGSPAEGMARIFVWMPVAIAIIPWGYAWRTLVWSPKTVSAVR